MTTLFPSGYGDGTSISPAHVDLLRRLEVLFDAVSSDMPVVATLGDIAMEVDYLVGVSPAAGTVVRNQAEYDALGAPLKYCQDAVRILPECKDHYITVALAAGDHYAAPWESSETDTSAAIYLPDVRHSAKRLERNSASKLTTPPGIAFVGAIETTEEGLEGAFSLGGKKFTRDAGTWTPGECKGRRINVTEGENAGQVGVVIIDNTATALTLNFSGTDGDATIDVYRPASILLSYNDESGEASSSIVCPSASNGHMAAPIVLRDIQFGDDTHPSPGFYLEHGSVSLSGCNVIASAATMWLGNTLLINTYLRSIVASYFRIVGQTGSLAKIQSLVMEGQFVDSVFMVWNANPNIQKLALTITDGIADIFRVDGTCSPIITGACIGNAGTGRGIVCGEELPGTVSLPAYPSTLTLKDCDIAIEAKGSTLLVGNDIFSSDSTGHGTGWKVWYGARVVAADPQRIGATAEIMIDDEEKDYTDIVAGSELVGQYKSTMLRPITRV